MSLESEYENVRKAFGIDPASIIGHKTRNGYIIDRYLGHGKIGVVFHAIKEDTGRESACKIVPEKSLKVGWDDEFKKLVKLEGIEQVVQYQEHCPDILPGTQICYLSYAFSTSLSGGLTLESMSKNIRRL